MDDLPEVPFEKVLSYLSLEDRLKARAVSRRWYHQINRFKVKTLCYSGNPAGSIRGKNRLVCGAYAQNFIKSTRFVWFFNTSRPILSNLKHLRFCNLRMNAKIMPEFFSTFQSFTQLKELDIIQFDLDSTTEEEIKLSLPMLTSFRLERVYGIENLTLDAPRLSKIKTLSCDHFMRLELVHTESVEWLTISELTSTSVEKLKKLKYLYNLGESFERTDSTFLSSLEQLKEIHLKCITMSDLEELFDQKQQNGRADLKIYLLGFLLNGPDDPAIRFLARGTSIIQSLRFFAQNSSRLADELPFSKTLSYPTIGHVSPDLEISLLRRITNLTDIYVNRPVEDTEHFLNLLKNLDIVCLNFQCDQPQDLFDRLPEHCSALQELIIARNEELDARFLFRLKHLILVTVNCPVDAESIRKVLEENEFLHLFAFSHDNKRVQIRVKQPKRFKVCVGGTRWRESPDLDSAIQFITGESPDLDSAFQHVTEESPDLDTAIQHVTGEAPDLESAIQHRIGEASDLDSADQLVTGESRPVQEPAHQPAANVFDQPQVPPDPPNPLLAGPVSWPAVQFPVLFNPVQHVSYPVQNNVLYPVQYLVQYPVTTVYYPN